jgi:predicted DNA-binding transcriptional regulator AlpA
MPAGVARDARTDNQLSIADPLSAAIIAAVDSALAARLPDIIDAIKAALPKEPPDPKLDRFVPLKEVAATLNCNRSTVHRRIAAKQYPPLRHQGAAAGYFKSDLDEIVEKAKTDASSELKAKTARARRGRKVSGACS